MRESSFQEKRAQINFKYKNVLEKLKIEGKNRATRHAAVAAVK